MRHHWWRRRNQSLHQGRTARHAQRHEHIPRGIYQLAGMQGRCRCTPNLLPKPMRRMNRSKLYEWLLDNDCPFEWETDEGAADFLNTCTLIFSDKEEE